ncbi:MAG: lysophospholipid acyltransferase family protein [Ignavibacteria bacterium]|nr:lysophospholipid acyltransferase family protein [Ignavibacteria bacterium]
MIYPHKNKAISAIFSLYIKKLFRKFFYRVSIYGEENFSLTDKDISTLIIANHSSWWDGFTAWLVTSHLLKVEDYLMMDYSQLRKYRFFRFLGAYSVDKSNPVSLKKSLEFTCSLLKQENKFVWFFPQGEIKPQDSRPLGFQKGIEKIIRESGRINLVPVAFRYEFTSEQRPEVFILTGKPILTNGDENSEKTVNLSFLEKTLEEISDELKSLVINQRTEKFRILIHGKPSRNNIIDRFCRLKE